MGIVASDPYEAQRGRPCLTPGRRLNRRLQIMLSESDVRLLEALVQTTGASSMGEAIRNAIHNQYHELLLKSLRRQPEDSLS